MGKYEKIIAKSLKLLRRLLSTRYSAEIYRLNCCENSICKMKLRRADHNISMKQCRGGLESLLTFLVFLVFRQIFLQSTDIRMKRTILSFLKVFFKKWINVNKEYILLIFLLIIQLWKCKERATYHSDLFHIIDLLWKELYLIQTLIILPLTVELDEEISTIGRWVQSLNRKISSTHIKN